MWSISEGHSPSMTKGVSGSIISQARPERPCLRLGPAACRAVVEDRAVRTGTRARRMTKVIIDGNEIDVPPEYHAAAGVRGRGRGNSALLLPRAAVDRRQLPHVPGRGEGRTAEAASPPAPWASATCRPGPNGEPPVMFTKHADGEEGARRRDGIPADQPSARLPDLRPGRRMRSAGPGDGLWRRRQPLRREQARGRGQIYRRAGQDLDEPLHPVHALRPLHDGSRGRAGARRHRPRRGHGDHHLSRTRR